MACSDPDKVIESLLANLSSQITSDTIGLSAHELRIAHGLSDRSIGLLLRSAKAKGVLVTGQRHGQNVAGRSSWTPVYSFRDGK